MEDVKRDQEQLPTGYFLGDGQAVSDVLQITEELLASEGLGSDWPTPDDRERIARKAKL